MLDAETLAQAQVAASRIHVSERLADYVQALVKATRDARKSPSD